MKINKNSWHYKWADYVASDWNNPFPPSSLCAYFWTVVLLAPLKFITVWALIGLLISFVTILPVLTVVDVWFDFLYLPFKVLGFLSVAFLGSVGFVVYREPPHHMRYLDKKRKKKNTALRGIWLLARRKIKLGKRVFKGS